MNSKIVLCLIAIVVTIALVTGAGYTSRATIIAYAIGSNPVEATVKVTSWRRKCYCSADHFLPTASRD